MKIGIMQPYFFPYIGYFQLINAVDVYVNLNHVSFMKGSYMTRNVLKKNIPINIDVSNGSQNRTCTEINVIANDKWFDKFYKTLELNYKKEFYFKDVMENIIEPWKLSDFKNISDFNFNSIVYISKYLDIKTEFISSSVGITQKKLNKGLQDIIKHFNATTYINAIGGKELYSKDDFKNKGIELKFIEMKDISVHPKYISILDLLFRYDKEILKEQLNRYILV
jgi:hypothetical protein